MRKKHFISILTFLSVFLLTACVSSRTTEHRVSTTIADSTSLWLADSAKVMDVQKGSTQVTIADSTHLTADVSEKEANEETITEQITESYDTLGNKTITTHRTIQRNGNYVKQTYVDASFLSEEQALKHYMDSVNCEWNISFNALQKSVAKHDSINNTSEKNTSNLKSRIGWGRTKQFFFIIVCFGLLIWGIQYVRKN